MERDLLENLIYAQVVKIPLPPTMEFEILSSYSLHPTNRKYLKPD
jgi:hypothetical protein